MKNLWAWVLGPTFCFCSGGLADPAWAQSDGQPKTTAETLFNEGRALMKQKAYPEACLKFEESLKLARGIGILFNLADCYEQTDRTASAWARFSEVAEKAAATGQSAKEEKARERLNALLPKLSKIRLVLPQAPEIPGLRIRWDGVELDAGKEAKEMLVDPGRHTVEASAPDYVSWSGTVVVGNPGSTLPVRIPRLELKLLIEEPLEQSMKTSAKLPPPPPVEPPLPVEAPPQRPPSMVPAYVLGSVAVVGAVGALGMFLGSNGKISEGETLTAKIVSDGGACRDNMRHSSCDELDSIKSTVSLLDGFAIGAGVVGAAAAAGAIGYWAWTTGAGMEKQSARRLWVQPSLGGNRWGLSAAGTF